MTHRMLIHAVALALVAGTVLVPSRAEAAVDPAVAEQWLIYDINRARWNPVAFAAERGISVAPSQRPMPPLAVNVSLMNSSGFKAQQTVDHPSDFQTDDDLPFYHCSDATGQWVCPDQLAFQYGYPISPGPTNTIEAYWASNGDSFLSGAQVFMSQPSHRPLIFEWPDRHEIGVGWAENCPGTNCHNYVFVHVAGRIPPATFITGVVFADTNSNGLMDLGEGRSGVTVSRGGGVNTTTNAGGGFSLPAGPGTYVVSASGSGVDSSAEVTVDSYNVGVDFIASNPNGITRAYELCEGSPPTILGTGGNDTINGTTGNDVIAGLGGDDVINGNGGNDTICGGDGNDTINGTSDWAPVCPGGATCDTLVFVDGGGRWYRYSGLGAGSTINAFYYGVPGDIAFTGDWDCNGTTTPGLYRQSDGFVYLRNTNTQGVANINYFFGVAGDIPIAGDFDDDGCDTLGIYRPSEGRVYISDTLGTNGGFFVADYSYYFGLPGDRPFVGDFNGDGIDTIGLHRQTTGFVYLTNSHIQGPAASSFFYGLPGDRILAADWDGDGDDTVAVYRPSTRRFYINLQNTQSPANYTLYVGTYTQVARG